MARTTPSFPRPMARTRRSASRGAEFLLVPGLGHDFTPSACALYEKAIGDFAEKVEAQSRGG